MDLVLVRYAEMGLKSRAVRRRFEQMLVANMMSALAGARVEAIITTEQGRIFVGTDDAGRAAKALVRVMGVASVSPVIKTSSDLEAMKQAAARYSLGLMKEGTRFAVRARRIGTHPYSSMEIGRDVGSAIFLANEHKHPKVDLTRPEVEVYVEVRETKAYIFSEYLPGPGGLPMGSQGRVLALLENDRDALAAWLIMKRGCRIIGVASEENEAVRILKEWDPEMRVIAPGDWADLLAKHRAAAVVFGLTLDDFENLKKERVPAPAFFPLIGMSGEEIERRLKEIS